MAVNGKLTEAQMDQLEQWIGTGPKKFDLLYAITRDGCDPAIFHQKCDNQGPTITVLYNAYNSIYGGYNPISWDSSSGWTNDAKLFLFRLQFNGSPASVKFPFKSGTYGAYRQSAYGPHYGGGSENDLFTFNRVINKAEGYYPLNGGLGLGNAYDSQGVSNDQVNNGTMNVTELEVYKVTDGQRTKQQQSPWRKTPEWNAKAREELQSEIEGFSLPTAVKVQQSRILVIGPVGAGKSSFINTVASVFRGRVTSQASCGSAEHSVTSQYRMYTVRSSSTAEPLKFRLCDTRGLEETQGIDANDVAYLLDGHVPDGYHFNPSLPISSDIPGFKKSTTLKDRIHCVCIVVDGSTGGVLPEKILEKIKTIQSKIRVRGIPQILLLTKIDKICKNVAADTTKVFKSPAIEEQVEKMAQLFGVPQNHVMPVRNYIREIEIDDDINFLILVTLRQILRVTEDYMFNFLDEEQLVSDEVSGLTVKD